MENAEGPGAEEVYEQQPVEASNESVQDLGERFKEIAEQMVSEFHQRVDALDKKYTDLRHTMTMQVDTHTSEKPADWSWENLRETMFPHTVG
uniref:Uncharacterized protein n=1 Tax=Podoviridae sp. ctjUd6 TaxID=2825270 RepID=A0A8S5U2R3_9CAUD|nr:MAG TPA: hypothetical protein [Podoviridae sp. ctjUd6]